MIPTEVSELPQRQPTRLDNVTCPYCRDRLSQVNRNEDHVIGRRFVPKGKLNGQWNLIVCACEECNTHKSNLEDDISAIKRFKGRERVSAGKPRNQ